MGYGFTRALVGAFQANFAEFSNTKSDGFTGRQFKIGDYLAKPHPRPVFFCNQKSVSTQLAQSGGNGQRNTHGGIIAAGDGIIA